MHKKRIVSILFALLALVLVSIPVMAATYYANMSIVESGANTYTMLPIIHAIDNAGLATSGYIKATGLDTRVLNSGSAVLPHLVVDDQLMFAMPISASVTTNAKYTLGNADASAMYIIPGYSGKVTTTDAAALEPASSFEIEIDGYFDSSYVATPKHILSKTDALDIYVSSAGNITADAKTTVTGISTGAIYDSSTHYLRAQDAVYATAWAAANGVESDKSSDNDIIGQISGFSIYRSAMIFDTSSIPVGATVTAAVLKFYGKTDGSDTNFNITVTNGQPTYPHNPVVTGDYNEANYSGAGGTFATAGFSTAGYNTLTLDETGRTWINKGGSTKLLLRSSLDISATEPGGNEYVIIYTTYNADVNKRPYLEVTYTSTVTKTLTSALTSGEHILKLNYDGASIKLYVDAVEKDSEALTTAIDNTANNWIWMDDNSMPYAEYIKYKVSGVLTAWYQPVSIIIGTALPDREGAAQNGAFTWGANPAGIATTLGGLVSYTQPEPAVPPDVAGTMTDIMLPIEQPGWTATSSLTSNPFYPIVLAFHDNTGFSEQQVWVFFASGLMIFAMIVVFKFLPHIAIAMGVGVVVSGLWVAMGIYPFWVIFVFVFGLIATLVMERTPSV